MESISEFSTKILGIQSNESELPSRIIVTEEPVEHKQSEHKPLLAKQSYIKSQRDLWAYDKHDETYATNLNTVYVNIQDGKLRACFNKMTDNIMYEKYISRTQLLDAIQDFIKSKQGRTCLDEMENHWQWQSFSDMAFNFRPYQGCAIS